ncbi:unnamed protein product [Effrenium voratum]|uniref:Uncharacterized protein n=1 Tax=Effrenium voratum TaxID=2562239 RepID=A0AA36N7D7_9DINO|nr:unnamed protein product [Effrenium voratum]CAJ1441190.1 unnamed protein product [Effrenium voratum]
MISVPLPTEFCQALVKSETLAPELVAEAVLRRLQPSASLMHQTSRPLPELHGGPEGLYCRDLTGRWRSLQEPGARRSASAAPAPRVREAGDVAPQPAPTQPAPLAAAPPQASEDPEVRAAQEALRQATAETSKLWEAAKTTLNPETFAALKRGAELERLQRDLENEKLRLQSSWTLLRGNCDRKQMGEITRLAAGCEAGRALSVEKARYLFDPQPTATARRRRFSRSEKEEKPRLPPRPRVKEEAAMGGA